MHRLVITAVLLSLATRPASAQNIGRVLDARSNSGVATASIQVLRNDSVLLSVLSDKDGSFSLGNSADPDAILRVSRIGYTQRELRLRDLPRNGSSLIVTLEPEPVPLSSVEVRAERNRWLENQGFYARQRVGLGRFITRDAIEKRYPTASRAGDILMRVPGVANVNMRSPSEDIVFMRGAVKLGGVCRAKVYVDGLGTGGGIPRMHPDNIEAIEVYRGPAEVPPQYGGSEAACGVILVWTRTGAD